MEKAVLLSLHPKWWEKMKTGEKTLVVQRDRPVGVELPVRVIVYATAPVSAIVGEFLCGFIYRTRQIYRLEQRSRVPAEELLEYANGGSLYGWTVDDVAEYSYWFPLDVLGINRPPQSWQYIDVEEMWP